MIGLFFVSGCQSQLSKGDNYCVIEGNIVNIDVEEYGCPSGCICAGSSAGGWCEYCKCYGVDSQDIN